MTGKRKNFIIEQHILAPRQLAYYLGALIFLIVASMLSFAVNAFSSQPLPTEIPKPVTSSDLLVFKVGQGKSLSDFLEHEKQTRLFFMGENHRRYDHHLVQLAALKTLFQQSPDIALGVEWFQQPFQKYLDDYIAGKLSEPEMLDRTGYFDRWRYDYRLYRPIMQFARENNIPVIALNASAELSKAIRKKGLEELPENLKWQLPENMDWSDKAYQERLKAIFRMHPEYPGKLTDFIRGQLTWDESMAFRTATFLKDNPGKRLLVLAGNGHIEYGSGIPNRVERHIETSHTTLMITDGRGQIDKEMADYLIFSQEILLPPAGLIGAFLENRNKRLIIKDFSLNSAARDADIPKGAIILGVDERPVASFTEFKIALLDKLPGDSIKLSYIASEEQDINQAKTVSIKLR